MSTEQQLPYLSINTQSVVFMTSNQLTASCADTSDELKEVSDSFDLTTDTNSKNYRTLQTLLKDYLSK